MSHVPFQTIDRTTVEKEAYKRETGAGFYFCKIVSKYGELIGKIIVLPK